MLLGLRVGDLCDETAATRLAEESVRDVFLVDDPTDAEVLVDKAIVACNRDDVPEIQSLGRTLGKWRGEILNHRGCRDRTRECTRRAGFGIQLKSRNTARAA